MVHFQQVTNEQSAYHLKSFKFYTVSVALSYPGDSQITAEIHPVDLS